MRKLVLLAAALIGMAALSLSATAAPARPAPGALAGPSAGQLLAKTQSCKQISSGKYQTDSEKSRTVPVCDANGAVWWRADLDIDCDGQRTSNCNDNTDPWFQPDTAFHRSDGKPLISDQTRYVVVPSASSTWRYSSSGLAGAGSCAVVYHNKVVYAVIGDTGPTDTIGEASHATARSLGIDPDPRTGGTDGPVTYICFKNSKVSPIEDNGKSTSTGERLANTFVWKN